MDKGVLIFAINSSFDYIASAEFAALQAKKYLHLPVTLVTNVELTSEVFDNVIVIDDTCSSQRSYRSTDNELISVQWFNESRVLAYNLSPYDKTLLIDSDFFMFNSSLLQMFDTDTEIACYSEINDVTGINPSLHRLNSISIPMQWATVIYFKKCLLAKSVFDFMQLIKADWQYYSMLYNFRNCNFRNDFALSIALQTLTGYSTSNFDKLPGKLHSIFSNIDVISVQGSEVMYACNDQVSKITGTNIHCMNKIAIPKFYA